MTRVLLIMISIMEVGEVAAAVVITMVITTKMVTAITITAIRNSSPNLIIITITIITLNLANKVSTGTRLQRSVLKTNQLHHHHLLLYLYNSNQAYLLAQQSRITLMQLTKTTL